MTNTTNAVEKYECCDEFIERRRSDDYEYAAGSYDELMHEVMAMEENSTWIPGVITNKITVHDTPLPLAVPEMAEQLGMPEDILGETADNTGTHVFVNYGGKNYCVRRCGMTSLYDAAKLNGSALGRMEPWRLADTLNNGLAVARGSTLMLERYGKAAAFHSDSAGGYMIMPISELLQITDETLRNRFGNTIFISGYNSHEYTSCMWYLTGAKQRIMDQYVTVVARNGGSHHKLDFTPAIRFSASDTAASSAMLVPYFMLSKRVGFRLCDGVAVRHERKTRGQEGIEAFREKANEVWAKMDETTEALEALCKHQIYNWENCIISICKKLGISKKYGEYARADAERYAQNEPCVSANDIYLSMVQMLDYAVQLNASSTTMTLLEEAIAKIVRIDWDEHDVGGTVAW